MTQKHIRFTLRLVAILLWVGILPSALGQNFSPTDLGGGLLWFKADSGVVQTANAVTQWNDVMGGINDSLVPTIVASRPTYLPDAGPLMNNKPALYFDGVNDLLTSGVVAGLSDSSLSVFIVAANDSQNIASGMLYVGSGSYSIGRSAAEQLAMANSVALYSAGGIMPAAGHNYRLFSAVKAYMASHKVYVNDTLVISTTGTNPTGPFANGAFRLGRSNNSATYWKGPIAEVIVYRSALDSVQRKQVEDYLYNKYAPPVNLGPDIIQAYSLCPVTLNASKRFVKYLWSNGSTADTLRVSTGGNYWVRTTDVFGRVSTDTVVVTLPDASLLQPDTVICLGSSITLSTNLPSGGFNYLWSNNSTASTLTTQTPGQYSVTVSDINNANCSVVSNTILVSIDSFSSNVSLGPDASLCVGNMISLASPPANMWGSISFSWQPGGITTPTYTVTTSGQYSITAINSNGCVGRDTIAVTIIGSAPTVAFTVDTTCLGEAYTPINTSASTDANSITSYQWDFGNGNTATIGSPTNVYAATGIYNVTLTVTTSGGCSSVLTKQQLVRPLPTALFSIAAQGCINNPLAFESNSIAATGSTLLQTQWYFGDGGAANQQQLQYTYNVAGTYFPQLVVADNFGCTDTLQSQVSIVASAPGAGAIALQMPSNNTQQVSKTVNFAWIGTAQHYKLLIANNSAFTNASAIPTGSTTYTTVLAGNSTYYWKVRAYNICNDSTDSQTFTFSIFSPTDLGGGLLWFKADSGVVQTANAVTQWNDVMGGINDSLVPTIVASRPTYLPDAGPLMNNKPALYFDGVNDLLTSGVVAGISDSSLSVFIVAANDSQNVASGMLYVGSGSYFIGRSAGEELLIGNAVVLSSAGGIMPAAGHNYRLFSAVKAYMASHKVYVNDTLAISTTAANPTGPFANGAFRLGRYNNSATYWKGPIAEVIVYRSALDSVQRKQVGDYLYNKYAPPVNLGPDIVQAYSLCPVTLNASKRFVKYLWSNGSTADTLRVTTAGIYWVRTTDVFGRVSSDTVVVDLPYKGLSLTDTVLCYGNNATIQALLATSPYSFAWNNGETSPAITVNTELSYNVTITDTNGCFVISEPVNVDVDSFPILSLLPADTITCIGNLLAIDSHGYSIASIAWSNGQTLPTIGITGPGIYSVTVTNTNQCSVIDAVNVTTNGTVPSVDFTYTNACLGLPNTFSDISVAISPDQINTIAWEYGDGDGGNGQNVSHAYAAASIYTATLTVVTDSGCTKSISKDVEVYGLPTAVLAQIAPICAQNKAPVVSGAPSTAPFGSTINSWNWIVNNALVSTNDTLSYSFPIAGIVPLTLAIATDKGCVDTALGNVEVYAPFVADFEYGNVCSGDSTYFKDVTPSLSIIARTWSFGDATSAVGNINPAKKYANPGSYSVTLTVTNALGCRDTSVKTVIVSTKPSANFTNLSGCEDAFYKPLDASTSLPQDSINTWNWTIGGFAYNTKAPQRYFANPGTYPVKLVVRTGIGCVDSISKSAIIYPRPTVNFSYTPLYGDAPLNVNFTNQSTNDSTYFWEFGDGGTATQENPAYTYTQNGEYNVKLTVTSGNGCSASRTKPYSVIYTELDYAVNEAAVEVTPMADGSSLAEISVIGSNIGTRIIDHISYYVTLGGVGVIAEDWEGTLLSGQGLLDTFSAKFVVPAGKGDSYVCVTAMSVNNGQQELSTENNSQCFGITEGIKLMGPLPNPAFNQSKLGIILPKHGKVTIDVANMMGQYIVQGLELELPEGRSDYDLPVGQMTAGEYFIRILYNDEKVVRKFVISR